MCFLILYNHVIVQFPSEHTLAFLDFENVIWCTLLGKKESHCSVTLIDFSQDKQKPSVFDSCRIVDDCY